MGPMGRIDDEYQTGGELPDGPAHLPALTVVLREPGVPLPRDLVDALAAEGPIELWDLAPDVPPAFPPDDGRPIALLLAWGSHALPPDDPRLHRPLPGPQDAFTARVLLLQAPDAALTPQALAAGWHAVIALDEPDEVVLARLRALRTAFNQARAEHSALARVNDDRLALIRTFTHDLRKPLGNVRMAEMLLRHFTADHADATRTLDGMLLTIDSMQELLEDFFTAFTLNEVSLEMEAVSLGRLTVNLGLQFQVSADTKGILLDVAPCDLVVRADHARLAQVVGNLLSNAIKYSPSGTQVRVWCDAYDGLARLNIADEGPGVPVGERHRLFTEFGRLSTRPTGQEASTGLGLWIVRRLIEAMGGSVGATFPAQGGSIFWIQLPLMPDPSAG